MSVRDLLRDAQKQLTEAKARLDDLVRSEIAAREDVKRLSKVVEYLGGLSGIPSGSIPVPLHPKPGGIEVIEESGGRESGVAGGQEPDRAAANPAAQPAFPCGGRCGNPECRLVFSGVRQLTGHLGGAGVVRAAQAREPLVCACGFTTQYVGVFGSHVKRLGHVPRRLA